MGRYLSIWFPYLIVERAIKLRSELLPVPFIVAVPDRGRMLIKAVSPAAMKKGISAGMVVADARAILPELKIFHDKPGIEEKLLKSLAIWCLRFTPIAAPDLPDGLLLEISGCPHLWGGEQPYLNDIITKLKGAGYTVKAAIADTIGAAYAEARYGKCSSIVEPGQQMEAISLLPPAALRLDTPVLERMRQLGFYKAGSFIKMPRSALRRRFGQELLNRIDQASGQAIEVLEPVQPPVEFQKRLPCLEPIKTRTGIEIALKMLLEQLCKQLLQESKGLRVASFKSYRLDGTVQKIEIGTNRPVRNTPHLLKLFEQKIDKIQPEFGIELFVLEAPATENLSAQQESIWGAAGVDGESEELTNLLDRIGGRIGAGAINRYLPVEHYWPERSIIPASSLFEKPATAWRIDRPRPIRLLSSPEPIKVVFPIPDYPPMLFIYKGKIHNIKKADGPERIEREWWLDKSLVRDYYVVEDEEGARYWLFRSGHYSNDRAEWFLHGFFA